MVGHTTLVFLVSILHCTISQKPFFDFGSFPVHDSSSRSGRFLDSPLPQTHPSNHKVSGLIIERPIIVKGSYKPALVDAYRKPVVVHGTYQPGITKTYHKPKITKIYPKLSSKQTYENPSTVQTYKQPTSMKTHMKQRPVHVYPKPVSVNSDPEPKPELHSTPQSLMTDVMEELMKGADDLVMEAPENVPIGITVKEVIEEQKTGLNVDMKPFVDFGEGPSIAEKLILANDVMGIMKTARPGSGFMESFMAASPEHENMVDFMKISSVKTQDMDDLKNHSESEIESMTNIQKDNMKDTSPMVAQMDAMTKEKLVQRAMERLKEMEKLQDDTKMELIVLQPQAVGEVIEVHHKSKMDGLNIMDMESELVV